MSSTRAGYELGSESYNLESGTHRFEYDQEETPPSMAIVTALSEVMDVDPMELEPLQESVDTEALDALVYAQPTATSDVEITLSLKDYTVTVHSYGVVTVTPAEPAHSEDLSPV